ncbi:MAG: signal recognition particle receptor subunit alpha, partial [Burkholderiales bacterium]
MLGSPASSTDGGRWFGRLRNGLAKTRRQLGDRLAGLLGAARPLDEAFYEELESALIGADVGVAASAHLLDQLRQRARREGFTDSRELHQSLQDALRALLEPIAVPLVVDAHRPFVIMLAGVNGSGKTTSIGKLAHYYQSRGKSVLLAAGDTFRAAAREQLASWAERN